VCGDPSEHYVVGAAVGSDDEILVLLFLRTALRGAPGLAGDIRDPRAHKQKGRDSRRALADQLL